MRRKFLVVFQEKSLFHCNSFVLPFCTNIFMCNCSLGLRTIFHLLSAVYVLKILNKKRLTIMESVLTNFHVSCLSVFQRKQENGKIQLIDLFCLQHGFNNFKHEQITKQRAFYCGNCHKRKDFNCRKYLFTIYFSVNALLLGK